MVEDAIRSGRQAAEEAAVLLEEGIESTEEHGAEAVRGLSLDPQRRVQGDDLSVVSPGDQPAYESEVAGTSATVHPPGAGGKVDEVHICGGAIRAVKPGSLPGMGESSRRREGRLAAVTARTCLPGSVWIHSSCWQTE